MKRKYLNIAIIIIVAIILFSTVKILYNNLSENHIDNVVPEKAPESYENVAADFAVYNAEGEKVSLSSFKGKPVVINFWATWCGFCVDEFVHFEKANEIYGDKVEFMMIDLVDGEYETVEKAKSFINQLGYTFPVYFDIDADAAMKNAVTSIPVTMFIDENGNIANTRVGAMNEQMLFAYIENLIGE